MKNIYSFFICFVFIFLVSCEDDNNDNDLPQDKSITLSQERLSVLYLESTEEITLSANIDWEVNNSSNWIDVSPLSGKASDEQQILTLSIARNDSYDSRSAQIVIKSIDGQTADTLTIEQSGVTDYIPVDWSTTTITYLDLKGGKVVLDFNGKIPSFIDNKSVIVLQNDTGCFIRKIHGHTVNGNTATLQTSQGNMSDIFINQSLELSTDPSTKSGLTKGAFITTTPNRKDALRPSKIIQQNPDGSYQVIYDANNTITKSSINIPFFNYSQSFAGKTLWKGLQWEKCSVSSGLGVNVYIKFNSTATSDIPDTHAPKGVMEEFQITFDGSMGMDLLLKYIAETGVKLDEDPIKLLPLPKRVFFFTPPTTPIPFSITLESDIMMECLMEASAKVEMTAGFRFEPQVSIGMRYRMGESKFTPIYTFDPNFEIYKPTVSGNAEYSIYTSVYPHIKVKLYDFVGPIIDPCFYLADDFKGGFSQELFGTESTCGWTNRLYSGLNLNMGLSLGFAGLTWEKYLPTKSLNETTLVKSPCKIVKTSPSDDLEYNLKDLKTNPLDVAFKVTDEKLGQEDACWAAVVKFVQSGGSITRQYALSDTQGGVKVQWTPAKKGDKLTAMILDSEGKVISQVTYTPKIKIEKSIIGEWLAIRDEGYIKENGIVTDKWDDEVSEQKMTYIFYDNGRYHFYDSNWIDMGKSPENGTYTYDEATGKYTEIDSDSGELSIYTITLTDDDHMILEYKDSSSYEKIIFRRQS